MLSNHQGPKKPVSCSICKSSSSKSIAYVCECGHLMYKDTNVCDSGDVPENTRKDNGDSLNTAHSSKTKHSQYEIAKKISRSKDLASGDHVNSLTKSKSNSKSKSEPNPYNVEEQTTMPETSKLTREPKIIHEYKNPNYCESGSGSSGSTSCPSLPNITKETKSVDSYFYPRPVICPILECSKMIALDSVLLHFCFDHSKIPRITLNLKTLERTYIQPSLISENTRCCAIFLVENKDSKRSTQKFDSGILLSGSRKDCSPLFLMAARIRITYSKLVDKARFSKTTLLKNAATQTDQDSISRFQLSYYCSLAEVKVSSSDKIDYYHGQFEKDEILVLWLCKLDEGISNYRITLLREDEKQGHSYIGEAIHIRDKQDPGTILEKAECLNVRGVAANRLIDNSDKIIVVVNILDCL